MRFVSGIRRRLHYRVEQLVGGGPLRERVLLRLLEHHYASRFRRDWHWSASPPHFFEQRLGFFRFAFTESGADPAAFYRGFFGSEIVREGDRLFDIGCGDGFFTRRFYAERGARVDAIDVEPSAIQTARAKNAGPQIKYHLRDAVAEPFPAESYDVIVWDGALGHFAPEATHRMLQKIRGALAPGGIFVGSESLKREGHDHLQFFESLEDLRQLLAPYFRFVGLRAASYKIGPEKDYLREEAYWRCSDDKDRLLAPAWTVSEKQ
jgi:SAM-dependent methyltransferase